MSVEQGLLNLAVSIGSWSFSASGETQVVLDAYEDFKGLIAESPAPPSPSPSGGDSGQAEAGQPLNADADATPAPIRTETSLPLKPYLERLKLRGNKEKATAIIAWSGESGEKPAITIAEIESLWKKTRFKAPTNLARDVRAAESEGWLDSQGKSGSPEKTYSINGYGEGIVAGWIKDSAE